MRKFKRKAPENGTVSTKKKPKPKRQPEIDIDQQIAINEANYNVLLEMKRKQKLIGFRTPKDNR